MKYLNYRNEFLNNKSNFEQDYKSSLMIREVLENQLRFGDSLVGRFINSAIRVLKIGYQLTKIPNLLKEFEKSLCDLIKDAMTEDMSAKFHMLSLKALFEELKNACLSSRTDPQKLGILIGFDGTPMYNPRDPNAPIPGYYGGPDRQILSTPSIVQDIIDTIVVKLPNLDKIIGQDRDKMLDKLSEFADALRKQTVGVPAGGGGAIITPFHLRLTRILNGVLALNESINYFFDYELMLEEAGDDFFKNKTDDEFEDWIKANPGAEQKARKLRAKAKGEKYEPKKEEETKAEEPKKAETGVAIIPKGETAVGKPIEQPKSTTPNQPQGDKPQGQAQSPAQGGNTASDASSAQGQTASTEQTAEQKLFDKLKELADKLKPKITEKEEDEISSMSEYSEFIKCFLSLSEIAKNKLKEKKVKVDDSQEETDLSTAITTAKEEVPAKDIEEKPSADAQKTTGGTASQSQKEVEKPSGEAQKTTTGTASQGEKENANFSYNKSDIYSSYIRLILEEQAGGPGGAPGATGATGGGGNAPGGAAANTVEEIWRAFWEELDRQMQGTRMSQREVEELNDMIVNGSSQLVIDFTMRPDPLIRIVRIFERAHNCYYTPTIPSGRSDPNWGAVSSQTYREYSYVGNGTPGIASNPGYGPWVSNVLFRKWTDGVMRIIQNQQYREVLSNMNFVVAGSADLFNQGARESLEISDKSNKIFEAETRTAGETADEAKKKKSHGEILFDFINDMLDKQIQGDFDGARKKLLRKYFGTKGSEDVKIGNSAPPQPMAANPRDVDADTFTFQEFNKEKFDNADCGHFFAFPIMEDKRKDNQNKKVMMFVQPIKVQGDKVEVKFTFDEQECLNDFMNKKSNSAKKINWAKEGKLVDYVYYGVLKNERIDQGFKICYCSINGSNGTTWTLTNAIQGEPQSPNTLTFKFGSGNKPLKAGNIAVFPGKLIYYDASKALQPCKGAWDKNKTSKGEADSDNLAGKDDLYNKLIAEGKKPEFGYWS